MSAEYNVYRIKYEHVRLRIVNKFEQKQTGILSSWLSIKNTTRIRAGVAWCSIPLKVIGGSINPRPQYTVQNDPLKLKVDTQQCYNTCNVDEYFQNTAADQRHISSQAPLSFADHRFKIIIFKHL